MPTETYVQGETIYWLLDKLHGRSVKCSAVIAAEFQEISFMKLLFHMLDQEL